MNKVICFRKKVYLCIKIQLQVLKRALHDLKYTFHVLKYTFHVLKYKLLTVMANYVIKEMPTGMGNGSEGKAFPKMQVYTEFDYDKVIELVHTNSPAFSQATIRGVLDTLAVVVKSYLSMGHTMKIDNLGVFSLSLQFTDNEEEPENQKGTKKAEPQKKYHHVKAKSINFRVDQKLIDEINRENTFERTTSIQPTVSQYSIEERLQRALLHIDKYGYICLQDYANINSLSYSSASRELAKLVANPESGIRAKGAGSHKIWVRSR